MTTKSTFADKYCSTCNFGGKRAEKEAGGRNERTEEKTEGGKETKEKQKSALERQKRRPERRHRKLRRELVRQQRELKRLQRDYKGSEKRTIIIRQQAVIHALQGQMLNHIRRKHELKMILLMRMSVVYVSLHMKMMFLINLVRSGLPLTVDDGSMRTVLKIV